MKYYLMYILISAWLVACVVLGNAIFNAVTYSKETFDDLDDLEDYYNVD